jgi:hypothetical protein
MYKHIFEKRFLELYFGFPSALASVGGAGAGWAIVRHSHKGNSDDAVLTELVLSEIDNRKLQSDLEELKVSLRQGKGTGNGPHPDSGRADGTPPSAISDGGVAGGIAACFSGASLTFETGMPVCPL